MPLRRTKKNSNDKRAYKYCGFPDDIQCSELNQTLGACRYLYNRMLADRNNAYQNFGDTLLLTPAWYKHLSCCTWLKEADSSALANVQINLSAAFSNFFSGKAGHPKFKKKSDHHDSYTTNITNGNISYRIEGSTLWLTLPKITGEIKVIMHRPMKNGGKLKHVTVSHEPNGKYYFSLLLSYSHEKPSRDINPDNAIGLDMLMHGLYMDSDGHAVDYPAFYRRIEEKIAREQRKLSHMKKGSSNYEKQRKRIARLYAKAKHQRADMLHKISRNLVDTYDIIGIEDLNMRGMAQSLNFGKSVMDKGWGEFARMLAYKASWYGAKLIKVGKFFPSSQMCHECGCLNKITKDLSVREVTCPHCGHHYKRDENAALNIRDEAVRIYCTDVA